jgi:hypothetical protein
MNEPSVKHGKEWTPLTDSWNAAGKTWVLDGSRVEVQRTLDVALREEATTLISEEPDGSFKISVSSVHLRDAFEPLRFGITVEKVPVEIKEGERYFNIIIDTDNEKLRPLVEQARELGSIPDEGKRLHAILDLLSKHMKYASDKALEDLSETDPETAAWAAAKVGLHVGQEEVRLSDLIERGYGVCRHFAVALLVLAQEAGMKGALMTNNTDNGLDRYRRVILTNIIRTDTGEPLFGLEVGEQVTCGHAWVELKVGESWIPVDPAHGLIGDTPENMQMFKDAKYCVPVQVTDIRAEGLPKNLELEIEPVDLYFSPGESVHKGVIKVRCGFASLPPCSYDGPLSFSIRPADQRPAGFERGVFMRILSIISSVTPAPTRSFLL